MTQAQQSNLLDLLESAPLPLGFLAERLHPLQTDPFSDWQAIPFFEPVEDNPSQLFSIETKG